jgi:NDP-sugar pyrophosphorylase family protein
MLDLIKNKNNAAIYEYTGYWLDIGRPDDYMDAIDQFEKNKKLFLKD